MENDYDINLGKDIDRILKDLKNPPLHPLYTKEDVIDMLERCQEYFDYTNKRDMFDVSGCEYSLELAQRLCGDAITNINNEKYNDVKSNINLLDSYISDVLEELDKVY